MTDLPENTMRFVFTDEQAGLRLDKALSMVCEEYSRSRLQNLIHEKVVLLNGLVCSDASRKVAKGHVVEMSVPEPVSAEPVPENIPLNIVYEDDDLLVIDKQVGLVVHPGAGNWSGTLVNALLYHCGDSLSGIGGVMRPGIVHRLDKDTSGLMVVAKNDAAHRGLSAQLEDRSLSRVYEALVLKVPVPPKGVVDLPLGRDSHNRLKMSVKRQGGKEARTHYRVLKNFGDALSLVECKLESGRTHQIRVHMQAIKNPLIGDPLYGPQSTAVRAVLKALEMESHIVEMFLEFPRQCLHAKAVSFVHPRSNAQMSFESSCPEDFCKLLNLLEEK